MKKILSLILLFLLTSLNSIPSSFANSNNDSNWKTYGFTEQDPITHDPLEAPVSASTTDNSFDVYIDTVELGHGSHAVFASNNVLSLQNNFQIDVNYHQSPESYNRLFMAIALGVAPFYNFRPDNTAFSDGSIRIRYDSKLDKLTTWDFAKNDNKKVIKTNIGHIENFKEDLKNMHIDAKNTKIAFMYSNGYSIFDDIDNPIQDRYAGFSDLKVTAAPEPVTTTLFLIGGGVMALGKLRRKSA
jgi:putative cell wall-binding protein